jgi:hypothetical protein
MTAAGDASTASRPSRAGADLAQTLVVHVLEQLAEQLSLAIRSPCRGR